MSIAIGSEGGCSSNQPVDVLVPFFLVIVHLGAVECGVGFGVQRAHGSEHSGHHGHGVGVLPEGPNELV